MPEQLDHNLDRRFIRPELANPTAALLAEIAEGATRDEVAVTYALAAQSSEPVDWRQVRGAIVSRWSPAALRYIERQAWKARAVRLRERQLRS